MSVWRELGSLWNWSSLAWLGAVAIVVAMVCVFYRRAGMRLLPLAIGMAFFLLAFVSPIGVLADGYLFSAHIIQHLVLLLIVPMCLVLSIPKTRSQESDQDSDRTWPIGLGNPILGWMCGLGAMWFWHVPTLCSAASTVGTVGAIRDASFVLAGMAFWWPVFAPRESNRLPAPSAVVYLFSACLGCTLLGIYLTFSTVAVCPAFAGTPQGAVIASQLYDVGLTPLVDQQLGGLLMWIPPCTLYITVILTVLGRWYAAPATTTTVHMTDSLQRFANGELR